MDTITDIIYELSHNASVDGISTSIIETEAFLKALASRAPAFSLYEKNIAELKTESEAQKARLNQFDSDLEESKNRIASLQSRILKCNPTYSGEWHNMTVLVLELKEAEMENTLLDALLCNMDLAESNIGKVYTPKINAFCK